MGNSAVAVKAGKTKECSSDLSRSTEFCLFIEGHLVSSAYVSILFLYVYCRFASLTDIDYINKALAQISP